MGLVLASASPRRHQLLSEIVGRFAVVPSDIPEVPLPDETAEAFAQRIAAEKAADVARRHPDAFVLGADTVVVVDGAILGKPRDREDARRMLHLLSGRSHAVLTAVALLGPAGVRAQLIVRSDVEFRHLSPSEIEEYLDTAEPYDKAGAYAVQGAAAKFVVQVQGSYSNVVGLPLAEVAALLRRHLPANIPLGAPP